MKDIGLFGINLSIAANKVKNAKTPEEAKFRTALINNDEAREVVDKVDFVEKCMKDLNGKNGIDTDNTEGVEVDAQAKKLGKVGRWMQGANAPLEAITTQAPKTENAPQVVGTYKDGNLNVSVKDGDSEYSFVREMRDDGSQVFRAGGESVMMNAQGRLVEM